MFLKIMQNNQWAGSCRAIFYSGSQSDLYNWPHSPINTSFSHLHSHSGVHLHQYYIQGYFSTGIQESNHELYVLSYSHTPKKPPNFHKVQVTVIQQSKNSWRNRVFLHAVIETGNLIGGCHKIFLFWHLNGLGLCLSAFNTNLGRVNWELTPLVFRILSS